MFKKIKKFLKKEISFETERVIMSINYGFTLLLLILLVLGKIFGLSIISMLLGIISASIVKYIYVGYIKKENKDV